MSEWWEGILDDKGSMEDFTENAEIMASYVKIMYNSFVKYGFDEEEAFELVAAMLIAMKGD